MITHKHHIVPRHAGGTDDPSNLVELSIADHAEAHRLLYEEHGRAEDKLAWQALSGLLSKEEILFEICSIAGKKGGAIGGKAGKGRKQSREWVDRRVSQITGAGNGMYGKQLTPEQKQRQGDSVSAYISNMSDDQEWQGTKNLKESVRRRYEDGTHPAKMPWTCVCGKSGLGKSNFNRWHAKCQITS